MMNAIKTYLLNLQSGWRVVPVEVCVDVSYVTGGSNNYVCLDKDIKNRK